MKVVKETRGHHTLYRLLSDRVDQNLGEAIVSKDVYGIRLHSIFVEPEHRGKGFGSFLMKALLEEAKAKPITLCTGFGNVPFFRKHNFEVTETRESLVFMRRG